MKRFLTLLAIIAMISSVLLGVFACKETPQPAPVADTDAFAAELVNAALPDGEENEAIKNDLLRYLTKANIEKADEVAILQSCKEHATEIGAILTALHTEEFDDTAKSQIGDALALVATAVSADVAGDLYYAVASDLEYDLPYTLSDCRKIATLYFTFYREIEGYSFADILSGELDGLGEREINTLLLSLASSLRAVKGLSENCKTYLLNKALGLSGDTEIDLSSQTEIAALKGYFDSLLPIFFDGYEAFLSYGAAFAANASAETFLGVRYEKTESTVYYGYSYDTWEMTVLTKEEYETYLATKQGFDTAFPVETMTEGYYVSGVFHPLSKSDIELAKEAGLLRVAYTAYVALTAEEKLAFKTHFESLLQCFAEEEAPTSAVSFDEMVSALSALSDFDSKDGVTDAERTAATEAIAAFEGYIFAYLPQLS